MNLRLRYGLRWRTHRPPLWPIVNALALVLLVGLIIWLALYVDAEHTALKGLVSASQAEADRFRQQLDACLNGGVVGRNGNVRLICGGAYEADFGIVNLIRGK